jgi:hypothetical protein
MYLILCLKKDMGGSEKNAAIYLGHYQDIRHVKPNTIKPRQETAPGISRMQIVRGKM